MEFLSGIILSQGFDQTAYRMRIVRPVQNDAHLAVRTRKRLHATRPGTTRKRLHRKGIVVPFWYKLRRDRKRKARILDLMVTKIREYDIAADCWRGAIASELCSVIASLFQQ